MTLHSPTESSLAVLNHKILGANSQVQNVKLGGHQTCLSINRLWHELCNLLRRLVDGAVLLTAKTLFGTPTDFFITKTGSSAFPVLLCTTPRRSSSLCPNSGLVIETAFW